MFRAPKISDDRLNLFSELTNLLLSIKTPEKIVEAICKKVMVILNCQVFFNFIADEKNNCLKLNAYGGISPDAARGTERLDYGMAVCGTVAKTGERIIEENIQNAPNKLTELVHSLGIDAYACHPLISKNKIIGTLSFGTNAKAEFSEDEIELMKIVADYVASALERKKTEEALRENEKRLNKSQEIAHLGSWELDLVNNNLFWSDEVYRIFGLAPQEFGATYEAFLEAAHPDDRAVINEAYTGSLRDGKDTYEIEHRVIRKSTGEIRIVHEKCEHIRDEEGKIIRSIGMVHDITEYKNMEEELKRSNENLKQFAYVVSHDLQEPLRIMTNYSQLLEKRYKEKLDEDASGFINSIVESAKRMQKLITDLLEYSRAGRKDALITKVDCAKLVAKVIEGLSETIKETGACVKCGDLPVINFHEGSFLQLFQNLIVNALKFRGQKSPEVTINAEKQNKGWKFSVKDNGIGIEPRYCEQIFQIFQRLHSRQDYPGTGIGLSICKKIVASAGGSIWVESRPGSGSTFYFTVPEVNNHKVKELKTWKK